MSKLEIEIPYTPRPLQVELHRLLDQNRFTVIVAHRRFGKTVAMINHLLKSAILTDKENPRLAYISPTYRQSKLVSWDYLKTFAGGIPGARFHETELRCDLPTGARIQLLGAENPSSLRGIYLDFCVMDEVADMPEAIFPEVIRPALSDRKGGCAFIGTPAGHNYFFDLWEAAGDTKGWARRMYRASETKIVDDDELEAAKAAMSIDQYNQEFECSWLANTPGAIFGKELTAASEADRITDVPYDPSVPVDTWWDIGVHDYTSIWLTQRIGRAVHVIDYYEGRGEGLPHYAAHLQSTGYLFGRHHGPHDLEVRELGSGKTRREVAFELGLNFRIVPRIPVMDGIHAARMILPICWFDRVRCAKGLESLRHYTLAYDDKQRRFRDKPVHNWASDAADAFRCFAVGFDKFDGRASAPQAMADNRYNPLEVRL